MSRWTIYAPAVLMSIKPKYCELIAAGKKTIEVRKTKPRIEMPFKCFYYECKGKEICKIIDIPKEQGGGCIDIYEYEGCGKVIGEYVCDSIDKIHVPTDLMWEHEIADFSERTLNILNNSCLSYDDMINYSGCSLDNYNPRKEYLYGWHISDLIIYDKPKELSEFVVIDKDMLKECSYRLRAYNNPDFTNGALLKGTYVCNNSFEPDFCRGQCGIATKPLTRPPQSWCYVVEGR